jgi:hypothetical protein
MTPAEEDYMFLPEDQAAVPARGCFFQRYADYWWAVHPEKGLVFYNPRTRVGRRRHSFLGKPQCNTDGRVRQLMTDYPFQVEVRQFPLVFAEISISDYMER